MSDNGREDPGYGYEAESDEYYTYDATDEEDDGRRSPLVVLTILALIVVFAGVVFFAYKQGLKQGAQGNPPVIRADDTPSKVAPVNPGGLEIPHQDRAVYNRLSGSGDAKPSDDMEHLLPRAEEPLSMKEGQPAQGATTPPVSQQTLPPAAGMPQQTVPAVQVPAAPVVPPAPAPTAVVPAPSHAEAPPAPASSSGGYVAQLASFRDEPAARAEFKKLQSKFSALAGLSPDIQKADLGAKGIYYRLRAGYLDKAKAAALCEDLKSHGQACFVRSR